MNTINGDITTVTSGFVVQQVNAQGVMNSGVAKALREKYPEVWEDYHSLIYPNQYDKGAKYMGKVIFTDIDPCKEWSRVADGIPCPLIIASIVGQQFYGRDQKKYTSYDALDEGFKLIGDAALYMSAPISVPLIGCGLGGGDWNVVQEIIKHRTKGVEVTLWLQSV